MLVWNEMRMSKLSFLLYNYTFNLTYIWRGIFFLEFLLNNVLTITNSYILFFLNFDDYCISYEDNNNTYNNYNSNIMFVLFTIFGILNNIRRLNKYVVMCKRN